MAPRDLTSQYQKLLEDYHSNVIDWKTFELGLFELKRERVGLASSDDNGFSGLEQIRRNRFTERETEIIDDSSTLSTDSTVNLRMAPIRPIADGSTIVLSESKVRKGISTRLQADSVLAHRYTLQHSLGRGTFGKAWQAKDAKTENYVVVKLLPQSIRNNTKATRRFFDAFRRVAALKHRNICPVYFLDEDDIFGPFTVSAYLDAVSLEAYHAQYIQTFQPFPLTAVIRVLWSVASALDYARDRKTFHRGLKPNNVLIGKDCGVLVTDFGLAETVRLNQRELGIVTNAPDGGAWRAPEVWRDGRYSGQSDQFSLAVLAYQLIADNLPFSGVDEADLREKIINAPTPPIKLASEFVNAALQRGLAKDPLDRFPSCMHFVKALVEPTVVDPRPGLGGFLFGVPRPAPPACIASETGQEIWPFTDDRIPQRSVYPYAETPMSGAALPTSMLGSLTGITAMVLSGLVVASLGAGIALTTLFSSLSKDIPPPDLSKQVIDNTTVSNTLFPPLSQPTDNDLVMDNVEEPTPVSVDELIALTEQASDGNVVAFRKLGALYFHGKGVATNYGRAFGYFRESAKLGDALSLYYLGRCNEVGLGVPANIDLAKHFYIRAEKQGSEEARLALRRLHVLIDN